MKVESINVEEAINTTRRLLNEEPVTPALKATIELLMLLITILANRLGLNSRNSSKPPSTDPNRPKKDKEPGQRKPGGQNGHNGTNLQKFPDPDIIKTISSDRTKLPQGDYKDVGFESRQVVDIDITRVVTEYRAQTLQDANGKKYTAPFPEGVSRPVQYGTNIKAHAVYLSQYQLIPYNRVEEYFSDQVGIPLSSGSIFNFIEEAYEKLVPFDDIVRARLISSSLCHADETGINIDKKRFWLHCVSNEWWTYFLPHEKRGFEAMEAMGVLPFFKNVLCHDHWKPYFKIDCLHALCNAHHLRELQRAVEEENQEWAGNISTLLLEINKAVDDAGGQLPIADSIAYRQKYRDLLEAGQKECPLPDEVQPKGKRGRKKRSRARNLLERLINYETETLRFMDDKKVPFSNNQGENDIRMTKVQQKISGCFRSLKGAMMFCRIRSYLSTYRKQGIKASDALNDLFQGKISDFLSG